MLLGVKKKRRARKQKHLERQSKPWMCELASLAAESRTDGGAGLHSLLHAAKFDERPLLSLTKRVAA
jgi:hypothetical protein